MGTTPVVSGLRHAADQRGDRADHSVQSLHSAGRAASHRHGSGAVLPGRTSSSWPRRTSTIWVDQRAARVVSAPRVETLSGSLSHQQRPQVVQRQRCLRHTNLVGRPNTGRSTNSTSRIQSGQSLTPDHVHVGQPDQQRAHSRSIGFQAGVPCNSTTSTSLRLAEPLWHAWDQPRTITQPSPNPQTRRTAYCRYRCADALPAGLVFFDRMHDLLRQWVLTEFFEMCMASATSPIDSSS